MDKIVIFQIGPVQEFISEARKTADFWAGSRILSTLMEEAIKKAKDKGIEVIYPYINESKSSQNQPDSPNIPNRFVGLVKDGKSDGKDAFNVMNEIEETVKNKLQEFAKETLKILLNNSSSDLNFFVNQVLKSFDIYWIVYPMESEEFSKEYKNAEFLFNSRKSVRDFEQWEGEEGFKCSICGKRIPVVGNKESVKSLKDINEYWDILRDFQQLKYVFKDRERLCAVCAMKRLYPQIPEVNEGFSSFPSTASIAVAPFLEKCVEKDVHFENFLTELNKLEEKFTQPGTVVPKLEKNGKLNSRIKNLDGSIFYEEQYKDAENGSNVINLLRSLSKEVEKKPSKYYAVIQIDGDSIGKHLRGKDLQELKDFSESIFDFSYDVRKSVEEMFDVKVGYLGGDEGIIFSPLYQLFDVIRYIREEFKKKVNDVTLSFGIAISHWSDPFQSAIIASREALKEAKNQDNKNSAGFVIIKRSGDIVKTVIDFNKYNEAELFKQINTLLGDYNSGLISPKWWNELYLEKEAFHNKNNEIDKVLLSNETKRLFRRRSKDLSTSDKVEIEGFLEEVINNLPSSWEADPVGKFVGLLELIEFVSNER